MPAHAGSGRAQPVLTASVELTSADILSLASSPVEVVAAPGAGKMILPLGAVAAMHFGTVAYNGGGIDVHPETDAGAYFVRLSNVFASTQDVVFTDGSQNAQNNEIPVTFDDAAFVVSCPSGNPTTGDGTCTVSVPYVVIDIA